MSAKKGPPKPQKWQRKTIRVRCDRSKVHAIGHIVKADWFEPAVDFARGRHDPAR